MHALEKKFIKKAIELGIPADAVGHVIRARRIAADPAGFLRRKAEARRINATSPYSDFVDKEKGYRIFGPGDVPGVLEAVAHANSIFDRKLSEKTPLRRGKPFLNNILEPSDLNNDPHILDFAKSDAVRAIATGYLQTVPKLSAFGIFYSPANDTLEKSQMWHTDDEDFCQMKCFINVNDVRHENGPFTFLPADKSANLRRKLGHRWRGPRVTDQDIEANCNPEDIVSLEGPPGSALMVDVSRCLHYGSRSRGGSRTVILFQYTRSPDLTVREGTGKTGGSILLE